LREQIKIYSALVVGFLTLDQYMPVEYSSSPEEATELLERAIHATMEPDGPIAPALEQELRAVWKQYTQQIMSLVDARLQHDLA
jgi:hypothetical protein